jgi:hypothetical protein
LFREAKAEINKKEMVNQLEKCKLYCKYICLNYVIEMVFSFPVTMLAPAIEAAKENIAFYYDLDKMFSRYWVFIKQINLQFSLLF